MHRDERAGSEVEKTVVYSNVLQCRATQRPLAKVASSSYVGSFKQLNPKKEYRYVEKGHASKYQVFKANPKAIFHMAKIEHCLFNASDNLYEEDGEQPQRMQQRSPKSRLTIPPL
jgi:hypothetical protein